MAPHHDDRGSSHYNHRYGSVKERILHSLADEQESLAKILKFLAVKVEKTAGWLPDTIPNESVNEVVEKVKMLESVITQELCATASKEQAIREVIKQICRCDRKPKPKIFSPKNYNKSKAKQRN
jgi:hypothetical protein